MAAPHAVPAKNRARSTPSNLILARRLDLTTRRIKEHSGRSSLRRERAAHLDDRPLMAASRDATARFNREREGGSPIPVDVALRRTFGAREQPGRTDRPVRLRARDEALTVSVGRPHRACLAG